MKIKQKPQQHVEEGCCKNKTKTENVHGKKIKFTMFENEGYGQGASTENRHQ